MTLYHSLKELTKSCECPHVRFLLHGKPLLLHAAIISHRDGEIDTTCPPRPSVPVTHEAATEGGGRFMLISTNFSFSFSANATRVCRGLVNARCHPHITFAPRWGKGGALRRYAEIGGYGFVLSVPPICTSGDKN